MNKLNSPVAKSIVAGIALVLNVFVAAQADNVLDMSEKEHILTTTLSVILGVYAVWRVPNADRSDSGNGAPE